MSAIANRWQWPEAKQSGSSITGFAIDLNSGDYADASVPSVFFDASGGQSPASHLSPSIQGQGAQIDGGAVWDDAVVVDYGAINASVGPEYDRNARELTLSADNSWQYEFRDLPKQGEESGVKYLYRYAIQEITVPGFTTSCVYENGEKITLNGGTADALGTAGVVKVI